MSDATATARAGTHATPTPRRARMASRSEGRRPESPLSSHDSSDESRFEQERGLRRGAPISVDELHEISEVEKRSSLENETFFHLSEHFTRMEEVSRRDII